MSEELNGTRESNKEIQFACISVQRQLMYTSNEVIGNVGDYFILECTGI
jgi:hypothetical protein